MTLHRLDEVAKALSMTLDQSRGNIHQKQVHRLTTTINIDRQGYPESLVWECRLPSGDGGARDFKMLRLPWASLYRAEAVDITELSIEVDCLIKKKSRWATQQQESLTAIPVNKHRPAKEQTHRIKLSAATQEPETAVSIDGLTVEEFLIEWDCLEQKQKEPAQKKRRWLVAMCILALFCLAAAAAYLVLYS